MNKVQATAPAKVILSGEHAVLYGAPALGVAIQKYCQTTIQPLPGHEPALHIDIPALQCKQLFSIAQLSKQHHDFKSQPHHNTRQITPNQPATTIAHAIMRFIHQYNIKPTTSMHVTLASNIPIASGLGSSAAYAVSLTQALCLFFDITQDQGQVAQLAIDTENTQHGQSSGLDVYLSLLGGCLYYDSPTRIHRINTQLPAIHLLKLGSNKSSTKDCVAHCRQHFAQDTGLVSAFDTVTQHIKQHLIDQANKQALAASIQENHRLLCRLGVVPQTAQQLIREIEQQGGAAKISGAGSIHDHGSVVIWATHDSNALQTLAKAHQANFETTDIHHHARTKSH